MRTRILSAVLCLAFVAAMLPARAQEDKKPNNDWIYVLLGGGIIYLLTHHPHTQERTPSPSPSASPGTSTATTTISTTGSKEVGIPLTPPSPEPSEVPSPRPTPDIYGHEDYTCKRSLDDGAFEAIQGPYQDDPVFKNKPDQLRREDGSRISYYGELDMIQNRPSTLVGVNAYVKDGQLTQIGSRNEIFMKGVTNCRDAKPVRMRFWLYEGGTKRRIYDSPPQYLQLFGPSNHTGQSVPWKMIVPAVLGQPEGAPFVFTRPGDFYAIEAELIDDHDRSLGFNMWLNGHVTQTAGPLTLLQPVVLSVTRSASSFDQKSSVLAADAATLQTDMFDNIPDVYPLAPKGLPVPRIGDPLDLSNANVLDSSWTDAFEADVFINKRHNQNFAAALADRLGATAVMQGVARTIGLLTENDMNLLNGANTAGRTLSTKVIVVRAADPWTTAAHELAHSLPEYIWSSTSMVSECELDYHNKDLKVSYGIQLTQKNVVAAPERHQGFPDDLMGDPYTMAWDGQCTYAHLIDGLRNMVDPQVLLVRFGMAREPRGVRAKLLPFYDVNAEVSKEKRLPYAIVALNAAGGAVSIRHFAPQWYDENGNPRTIVAMQEHLPNSDAIASVELRGPSGVLDRVQLSRAPPSVTIRQASIAGKFLHLSWSGSGEAGRTLRYSVLLSRDGGQTFYERVFELKENQAVIRLYEKPPLVVRVVVTDGTRSAQAQRAVR